jgi:hypothetical protein
MAKRKRHSSMEVATKLALANALATQGKLQSEIADRTLSEGDKIAELKLENSRLRQLVTDLLGWHELGIRRRESATPAKRTSKQAARRRAP